MTVHKVCDMEDCQRCVIEVNAGNLPHALLYADRRRDAIQDPIGLEFIEVLILALMCQSIVQSGHHLWASQTHLLIPFVPKQPAE